MRTSCRWPLALLLCSVSAPAQWAQAAPTSSPAPRIKPAMSSDGTHALLFGGANNNLFPPVNFNDTWIWDGLNWTQQTPTTSPSARHFAAMAFNYQTGRAVLYGGQTITAIGGPYLNDTWEWDGSNWQQIATANSPGGYFGSVGVKEHCMAYDLFGQRVVMFGGELFQGIVPAPNYTLEYDGSNWVRTLPPVSPPRRSQAAMCSAITLGGVLMFGGTNFNNPPGAGGTIFYADVWLYSAVSDTWSQIVPVGISPPPRADASLFFDSTSGEYVLYGGYISSSSGTTMLTDTWRFNGGTWTDVSAFDGGPSTARMRFSSCEAPLGFQLLFGGAPGIGRPPVNESWLHGPIAAATRYGAGCAGGAGVPTLEALNQPVLGGTLQLRATGLASTAPLGFFAFGISDLMSQLGALPLSLAGFGMAANCLLLQSADAANLALQGAGIATATFSLGTPNPAFSGTSLFYQYAAMDSAAPGGFAVSNGVSARLALY